MPSPLARMPMRAEEGREVGGTVGGEVTAGCVVVQTAAS
jgi:hypothetical protein